MVSERESAAEQGAESVEPGAADAGAGADGGAGGGKFVGHAVVVSGLTLVSRLTGLVRDAALAFVFGLSSTADAFFLGFLVPNLFRRLFGEGALTASFIPHYTQLLKSDAALARRFASLCLTLLSVCLIGLTLIGQAVLWALLAWGGGGGDGVGEGWSETAELAIRLTMVMLGYMPLVCLVALVAGVLQVHQRFGMPAAMPVVLNVVMIGAALCAAWVGLEQAGVAYALAWSVLGAGVVQLAVQLAVLWRQTGLSARFAGTGPALRGTLAMLLPMVVGLAVFQVNAFFDSLIAFFFSPRDGIGEMNPLGLLAEPVALPIDYEGAVAALQWAQRLYQFPLGVFGIAVATAIFPALAHAIARRGDGQVGAGGSLGDFRTTLEQGLRLTMFIALPAAVGLVLVREPLTRVIYERGEFTTEHALRVAAILAGYAASVWAYSLMHVLTRGFYALKDARTPLRISVRLIGFNLLLNLVLIWPLGAPGLAWSTAITASLQVVLLLRAMRAHVGGGLRREVWRSWGRTVVLTTVMAGVLGPLVWWFDPAELTQAGAGALLAAGVAIGAVIVLGGAWVIGLPELRWLVRRRIEAEGQD